MNDRSTIFALSTVPGRSALAVIRVSGPAAARVLQSMAGGLPEPRRAALRRLRDPATGTILDQALVLFFAGPASETGEDMAELQVHGGRAVVVSVLTALGGMDGCRLAEPGEFARRAFGNGKLDLAEAEGLADLIDAETEGQRRQALRQACGALSQLYEGWRSRLIEAAALVEAGIDFSDEGDVSSRAFEMARTRVTDLEAAIHRHLDDGHRGEILREGFRVVLAGPPNAGKSSLLNALARRDVAIVSEEAGTTRDVIEVRLDLGGVPVIISDTAGIREAAGSIEREGIRRTLERAREADLVIWLVDATNPVLEVPCEFSTPSVIPAQAGPTPRRSGFGHAGGTYPPRGMDRSPPKGMTRAERAVGCGQVLRVLSKADLAAGAGFPGISLGISAKFGQGIAELTSYLARTAADRVGTGEEPIITQTRHRLLIESCCASLREFLSSDAASIELRAEDLRRAAHALGRVTGRVDVEDVLDQVFQRFCIGK